MKGHVWGIGLLFGNLKGVIEKPPRRKRGNKDGLQFSSTCKGVYESCKKKERGINKKEEMGGGKGMDTRSATGNSALTILGMKGWEEAWGRQKKAKWESKGGKFDP